MRLFVLVAAGAAAAVAVPRPRLTFFTELPADGVLALARNASAVAAVRALGATVAVALRDLSPNRAVAAATLGAAGIPTVAWLLNTQDNGYWIDANNVNATLARYAAFREWSAAHNLSFTAVGLDLEVDRREINDLVHGNFSGVLRFVATDERLAHYKTARDALAGLVGRIAADGYAVHTYIIPLILDERRVGSTALQRATGLVDVGDSSVLEIPMLYSTLFGEGSLYSYAAGGLAAIGIGSTGGAGSASPGRVLSWTELRRDLLASAARAHDVAVYSLEGCVTHGYLGHMLELNWSVPSPPVPTDVVAVDAVRRELRDILELSCRLRPDTCNISTSDHSLRTPLLS